jgi:hypothetical protein
VFIPKNSYEYGLVDRAFPDDISGYDTALFQSPDATPLTAWDIADNPMDLTPFPGVQILTNNALAFEFVVYGLTPSTERRDADLNIMLRKQDQEIGGGTCRDQVLVTVIELRTVSYEVTSASGAGVYNCIATPGPDSATLSLDSEEYATVTNPGSTFTISCTPRVVDGKAELLTAVFDGEEFEEIDDNVVNRVSRSATTTGTYTLMLPVQTPSGTTIVPFPNTTRFDLYGTRLVPNASDAITVSGKCNNCARIVDESSAVTQDGSWFFFTWNTGYPGLGAVPFWSGSVTYGSNGPAAVAYVPGPTTPTFTVPPGTSVAPANAGGEFWTTAGSIVGTATVSHGVVMGGTTYPGTPMSWPLTLVF